MQRRKLPIVGVVAAAVLAVVTVGGLFVASALAEANGYSIDPTDPSNFNHYALRNDSSQALFVHVCRDVSCHRLDGHFGWDRVASGASDPQQVYWGDSTPTAYAVSARSDGQGARCLLIDARKKQPMTVSVPLSSAAACGR